MRTRLSCLLSVTLLAGLCASACTSDAGEVASQSEEVQYAYLGEGYYSVALSPPGPIGAASRASGTVFVAALDGEGDPRHAVDLTPLRYTCGVTFISPEHAITAAHCVEEHDVPTLTHPVTVQTYFLDDPDWQSAKNIAGVFPDFTHPMMTDGYHVETHSCTVVRRCGEEWGKLDCDIDIADTALLYCPSAPACKTGYLDVAENDDLDATVEMAWSHEIYSIPASGSLHDHYTLYDEGIDENFHYFGGGRNQLLPLLSRRYEFGDIYFPHQKTGHDVANGATMTDLLGCHGTSGSGTLQLDGNEFELLGPIARGSTPLGGKLCIPRSAGAPGVPTLGYSLLENTRAAARNVCRRDERCDDGSGEPTRFLPWLFCHRFPIDDLVNVPDWPWLWQCADCEPWEQLRLHDEPMVQIDRGVPVTIPGQSLAAGASYRFSARIVPSAAGATHVNVRIGGAAFLTRARPTVFGREHAGVITGTFIARTSGAQDLVIENDPSSGGTFYATEIVLARNDATNGFDRYDLRAGIGMISTGVEGGAFVPMRFTGDGRGGYAALLHGGERMLLTRQALAAGRTYAVSFSGDRDQSLTCRLLLGNGAVVSGACDVRSGRASVSLASPAGATPIGLAIDMPAGAAPIAIDDVVIR
jgi:hypothetical protein